MLDFTSALYLGMRHPTSSLSPWQELTTGRPAALSTPSESESVAQSLAGMLGCEQATLGTSTLHIFWDLFEVLAKEPINIYVDSGTYPIVQWGVERVTARGIKTRFFPCHDVAALNALLRQDWRLGSRPIVVTDGLSPATGKTAPLLDYVNLMQTKGGYVVVDDTQALGILGHSPSPLMPYGRGGAGSPAWHGIQRPELIVGSSLAKGLGVPMAVLGGSRLFIKRFEEESATRMHCSPPAIALIHAAQHALNVNKTWGEHLRKRLLQLVRRFREGLRRIGLSATGGVFPVQTLQSVPNIDAARLHDRLSQFGVRTVLHRACNGHEPRLSFLITALHSPSDIDDGVEVLQQAGAFAYRKFGGKGYGSTVGL